MWLLPRVASAEMGMALGRCRRQALLFSLLLTSALLLTPSLAAPTIQLRSLPLSLSPRSTLPSSHSPLFRGVDDVGPAFQNATQNALEKAKVILARYSTTVRILAIPTGLAVAFFGYFLLGPVLFLAGFVSGGAASFIAVNAALGDTTPVAAWVSIAAMLLGGAMLGFLALRALSVGMFAVGAALGVVLASAVKASLIAKAYPKDPELAFIIAAVACGLIFGLLSMCLQKQMLILSTAYAGSCAAVFGIGHFAGHFPTAEEISKVEAGKFDGWVLFYILLTLGLGTAGTFFQFWLGRGKPMPTHAPHDRRRRRRRVRHYEPDEWSDDADWEDQIYVERAPAPRRKYQREDRPDIQTPLSSHHTTFKDELPSARHPSYSRDSWKNVRNATSAFDEDSSPQESDPLHRRQQAAIEYQLNGPDAYEGPSARRTVQTASPQEPYVLANANLVPDPDEPIGMATELEAQAQRKDAPDIEVFSNDAPDSMAMPNSIQPLDAAVDTFGRQEGKLVNVSLGSDVDSCAKLRCSS